MSSNWIKWFHNGVPDQEGAERDDKRNNLEIFRHCKRCTALSGCYFPKGNMPTYPLHPHCDCLLFDIAKPTTLTSSCDIRKFTEYLFDHEKSRGKDVVFKNWGFNIGNSGYLKVEYESQALQKYLNGEYKLNLLDDKGQRITINISLPTNGGHVKIFKTGWMVHTLGTIACTAPFSGEIK